jgi:hypothetical protein
MFPILKEVDFFSKNTNWSESGLLFGLLGHNKICDISGRNLEELRALVAKDFDTQSTLARIPQQKIILNQLICQIPWTTNTFLEKGFRIVAIQRLLKSFATTQRIAEKFKIPMFLTLGKSFVIPAPS